MSLVDALKSGKAQYTGNSSSNVNIKVGDGNSNITVRGNNVDIEAGTGNQNVVVLGNDVDIKLDQNADADWDSTADFDNVAVISDKGNVNIDTGDGNDRVVSVADNINIKMGDGNHMIDFWGDNVNINVGDGNNQIMTMDKSLAAGSITEDTNWLGVNIGQAAVDAVAADTIEYTEVLYDITKAEGTDKSSFLNKMKDTYKLDDANMKKLEELYNNGELFKEFAPGVPAYAIVESVKQKNPDGSAKFVLAKVDSQNSSGYIHTRGLQDGTFKECIATKQRGTSEYTEQRTVTREIKQQDVFRIDGTKNLNIKTGNGDQSYINVTSTGVVDIKTGDIMNNLINVDAEVKIVGDPEIIKTVYTEPSRKITIGTNIGKTYTSPIVVDFNRDGKVSASSGKGIDANNDGIADGYASNGDKMLAMSDMNGNGSIDGSEAFGDQTVSPFTGQKYNAANGFEALKMVANEAEKYTGIKCLEGSFVNLQNLKEALSSVGVNLGFISDDNVTELEDLAHVAAINVDNYNEVDDDGDVQHRQQGSYIDTDGNEYSADDVWFKNRNIFDKMRDRMS
ncbi:MAG: hypothetical protein ACI37Z_02305 [Candidatus Gastranaerophilaceae bacterium]